MEGTDRDPPIRTSTYGDRNFSLSRSGMDRTSHHVERLSERLLRKSPQELRARQLKAIENALRLHASTPAELAGGTDAGKWHERLADRVAAVGGSWAFICSFAACLVVWSLLNSWLLSRPFDPYPYIFLNLILSTVAALQAPVIMMSQNRMAARDRLQAMRDFEVNLKAELEIVALHEKLDRLLDRVLPARATAGSST